MKSGAATSEILAKNHRATMPVTGLASPVMPLFHRLRLMVDWVCNGMRLIRAYNDLKRLDNHTLRDICTRPGDLDRVLDGRWNGRR